MKQQSKTCPETHQGKTVNQIPHPTYPAGLASLGGCWGGVKWCWPLVTTDSQLVSVVVRVVCAPHKNIKFKISEWTTKINCYLNLITTYILWLLAEIAVFVDQVRHLFLQAIVFLHQKLVHRRQLSIHSLQSGRLFPLLFSTPVTNSKQKKEERSITMEFPSRKKANCTPN